MEKEFIYRHSRAVFNIMDFDQSGSVSAEEFERIGFMFNFYSTAIRSIFKEFDVSGDSELDFKEFKVRRPSSASTCDTTKNKTMLT